MKLKDLLPPTWANWSLLCLCFGISSYYLGTYHTTKRFEQAEAVRAEQIVSEGTPDCVNSNRVVPQPKAKPAVKKEPPKEEHTRQESQRGWLSRIWHSLF